MGEAIPLDQAIKATKNLCTSYTETPYRDIYRDNPRGTPGGAPGALYYNNELRNIYERDITVLIEDCLID